MPRPKDWTESEVELRDECVESLIAEGVPAGRSPEEREAGPRSRAYAICTAMVERHRRTGNPGSAAALLTAAKTLWGKLGFGA